MRMPELSASRLREKIGSASPGPLLRGPAADVRIAALLSRSAQDDGLCRFSGRSMLIRVRDPLAAALALVELDGIARRVVICPPVLAAEHIPAVIAAAEIDGLISDSGWQSLNPPPSRNGRTAGNHPTEWVLMTSGTTGAPKLIVHTFDSLTASIPDEPNPAAVWGTFYDIRRYGGMQILLRTLIGQSTMLVAGPDEAIGAYLLRLGRAGVTHLSGTPSHWRRALMTPQARAIRPRYVRLSGEIVDQAILDAVQSFYPEAAVGHAFASTEAGVAFDVTDGREGFPLTVLDSKCPVEIKIEDGSLRIRSAGAASRYLHCDNEIRDADGFVDTGDLVEMRRGRCYFLGRRNGVINIGGLKVYPEEVESVINRHPAVQMSRVWARRSSIAGALVTADVVLAGDGSRPPGDSRREILRICRENLPAHKVPVALRCVPALELTAAGKLARNHA